MKNNSIIMSGPHKDFESIKKIDADKMEYWEARELMPLLGYIEWRKFEGVIDKAKKACEVSGQDIANHFVGADKMIKIAVGTIKEAPRNIKDYYLSRYACYLIAQNGDSRKPEVAIAQTYFAIQTRKQEIFEQMTDDQKRLHTREQVSTHNTKLKETAHKAGVRSFGKFNNQGYLGLYGLTSKQIQARKGLGDDKVLDRAGTTELAANLFRITQTNDKLKNENIKGEDIAGKTHHEVGKKVRKAIEDIGGTMPEDLHPEKHIKDVKKLIKKTAQKAIKS